MASSRYRGAVAAGHTVRLQSYGDGSWTKIVGARVRTGADGRYRLRVILLVRGVRDLRVVGVAGNGQRQRVEAFRRPGRLTEA